jgi:non-heme chloroperoxidase
MYYVEVQRNVKILVQDLNPDGKKPIVFIHGWPVNHKMFEYQFNVLPQYGFRCIGLDLRGFGGSDRPWEGYSYDRLADDVFKVIESLKVKAVTLVGFSMGGPIAIRYMARHSGYKVTKLVLLSAAAPSFTQHAGYPFGMTKEAVNKLIAQTYQNRPQMLTDFGAMFFASKVTPSFMNWFQSLGLEASGHGTIKTAISLRDEDVGPDLQKIQVPTGIFHGVLDKICPFDFAVIQHQAIQGSKLYRFEHSGHGVF